ncbi:MAG: LysM peptidoglycan-binding domain-containing protein [Caryophanon sp.]|nr:LysM peptidoglycan-binding domain-containing protein [Caryophanon sp.]
MSKEKITEPLDDGRQKIDVDYEEESLNEEQQKKQKQKSDAILTPIFLLFICIPIGFIIYFWKFYDPSVAVEQAKVAEHQVVEIATNPSVMPPTNGAVAMDGSQDDELTETEKTAAAIAAQEAAEKAAKAEAQRIAQQQAAEAEAKRKAAEVEAARQAELERQKAAAEAAAEAEAKRKAAQELAKQQQAQQAKTEAARQAEAAKQQAQQSQQKPQQPKARTHVVKEGETLYRIAVNYYGNGDAVERIKAANGLASNDIVVGKPLILP